MPKFINATIITTYIIISKKKYTYNAQIKRS